jgi:hypothetical protein
MNRHIDQGKICPDCGKEILNMLFEGHTCREVDILKKKIDEQAIFIEELKSQIPCPTCHGFGREQRYCPVCEVVCSPQEMDFSGCCIECKTEVGACPYCKGTGKKYPNAKQSASQPMPSDNA